MGVIFSEFDRVEHASVSWSLEHLDGHTQWSTWLLHRYGVGYSVTGVSSSAALPRLLRRRMQDWRVDAINFHLSSTYLSIGRHLRSISRETSSMFYGVDIRFGDHSSGWFYCKPSEWQLILHKALLEPLASQAAAPTAAPAAASTQDRRFPGRAYYLGDEAPPAAVAAEVLRVAQQQGEVKKKEAESDAAAGEGFAGAGSREALAQSGADAIDLPSHQLSVFLGNADGHVGLLCLPILASQVDAVRAVTLGWSKELEVPCNWAGRLWRTAEDFMQLREQTVNLPDLVLLALEPDVAMSLTPDWTWEKYPRGYGEVAMAESALQEAPAGAATAGDTEATLAAAREEDGESQREGGDQ